VIHNQSADGQSWHVTEIPIDGGNENQIVASRKTRIVMIVWLPDRSGLIMNAIDPETNVPQISFVSYPTGEERRITHDLNNYKEISVTADSRMIVAQKMGSLKQLWIAPERDSAHARLLSTATGLAYHSLSWAPHSQLVFDAEENGEIDIWKMSPDGGGREQLTHHEGQNTVPGVTPDGRYIVFLSTRTGSSQLWRMDADGNNPKQLTNSLAPVVELQSAPEGGWIFYKSYFQGQGKLFKIPIDGGEAIRVPHDDVQYWAISPNGKLIAYSYLDSEAKKTRIIVAPLAGGVPLARFDVEPDRSLQWINAGSGLAYVGLDNRDIWVQQLAGGPPRQVTNLQPDLSLINFTWSDDTKQLAYTRGAGTFDAVAISLK
jgi:Tol biopolymer transport system component